MKNLNKVSIASAVIAFITYIIFCSKYSTGYNPDGTEALIYSITSLGWFIGFFASTGGILIFYDDGYNIQIANAVSAIAYTIALISFIFLCNYTDIVINSMAYAIFMIFSIIAASTKIIEQAEVLAKTITVKISLKN
jgi:hypothetical protein